VLKYPLSSWLERSYGGQLYLHLGDTCIHSCRGVQQGDPLGPLGFAVALQPIVERIKVEVPNLKIYGWYLDDGTLVDSPSDHLLSLIHHQTKRSPRGLMLNRTKSLLFSPSPTASLSNPLLPDIPLVNEGFSLLGCPVGPSQFYCTEWKRSRNALANSWTCRTLSLSTYCSATACLYPRSHSP